MNPSPGRLFLIGYGNMGRALHQGLAGASCPEIFVVDPHLDGPAPAHPVAPGTLQQVLSRVPLGRDDTLVLCVKPKHLEVVGNVWQPRIVAGGDPCLVISLLAGVRTNVVAQHLFGPVAPRVVRAMPNIAAVVGEAATALAPGPGGEDGMDRAMGIFKTVGNAWEVAEDLLDAVTGLSGSGPAYVTMIIEALADGGVSMGLGRKLALDLAVQTVLGAGKLVRELGSHPAVIRDQVTTPAGTTIRAIHELERHGLRAMLMAAVGTATRQSKRLSRKYL